MDTHVACDTFSTGQYKGISYLDVTTVYSKETNTVYINVINRHRDKAISADIIDNAGDFSGEGESSVIYSDDLKSPFTIEKASEYAPVIKKVKIIGNKLSFSFPPHSFTQIKAHLTIK